MKNVRVVSEEECVEYEKKGASARAAVRTMLEMMGEDPDREGLRDTPSRVVRMFVELTEGYREDPQSILQGAMFDASCDEMVVVRDIPFWSMCEHHMIPFHGTATVGYIPSEEDGKVVGLSKIARVVHVFARRLQIQEKLTQQIARAMKEALRPQGVGVMIKARHLCMEMRGVKTPGETVTSCLLGHMRTTEARAEFLSIAKAT